MFKAILNKKWLSPFLAATFIAMSLATPQAHGLQSNMDPGHDQEIDHSCCESAITAIPVFAQQDQSSSPCCPTSKDHEKSPCNCHCCGNSITTTPVIIPIESKSMFFDTPAFLMIIPEARPEHMSLGVEIEPPIA